MRFVVSPEAQDCRLTISVASPQRVAFPACCRSRLASDPTITRG